MVGLLPAPAALTTRSGGAALISANWLAGRRDAFYQAGAIRSLFKTLAGRRVIFADPARSLHTGQKMASEPLPLPLPRPARSAPQPVPTPLCAWRSR